MQFKQKPTNKTKTSKQKTAKGNGFSLHKMF